MKTLPAFILGLVLLQAATAAPMGPITATPYARTNILLRTSLKDDVASNVRWFGAKGDGIHDDTLAIQSAISASESVYIPHGSYLTTGNITIPPTCLKIFGDGNQPYPPGIFTFTDSPTDPNNSGTMIFNTGTNLLFAFSTNFGGYSMFSFELSGITAVHGDGVLKLPDGATGNNVFIHDVSALRCTGTAFEFGSTDGLDPYSNGNAFINVVERLFIFECNIGVKNHCNSDTSIFNSTFWGCKTRSIEIRGANTHVRGNFMISKFGATTYEEDVKIVPTDYTTMGLASNISIENNKFGSEEAVTNETRVKIRFGDDAIALAHPNWYIQSIKVARNYFHGPWTTNMNSMIRIHVNTRDCSFTDNTALNAAWFIDEGADVVNIIAGNNYAFGNQFWSERNLPGMFRYGGRHFLGSANNGNGYEINMEDTQEDWGYANNLVFNTDLGNTNDWKSWYGSTATNGFSDPFGGTNATQLSCVTTTYPGIYQLIYASNTCPVVFSVWMKAGTLKQATLDFSRNASSNHTYKTFRLDDNWRRYAIRITDVTNSQPIEVKIFIGYQLDTKAGNIYAFGPEANHGEHTAGYLPTTGTAMPVSYGKVFPRDVTIGGSIKASSYVGPVIIPSGGLEIDGTGVAQLLKLNSSGGYIGYYNGAVMNSYIQGDAANSKFTFNTDSSYNMLFSVGSSNNLVLTPDGKASVIGMRATNYYSADNSLGLTTNFTTSSTNYTWTIKNGIITGVTY